MRLLKIKVAKESTADFKIIAELEPGDLFKLGEILEEAALRAGDIRLLRRRLELVDKVRSLYNAASELYNSIGNAVGDGIVRTTEGEWNAVEAGGKLLPVEANKR